MHLNLLHKYSKQYAATAYCLLPTVFIVNNLVIIPVFNEEQHIRGVLEKVRENTDSDILVINDGSTDKSHKILNSIGNEIKLINHTENQGYGKSLIDGFNFAISNNYQLAVTIDCDEQHEPHLVSTFIEEINNYDIVSGSRYLREYSTNNLPPLDRKQINDEITKIINRITGYNLTDSFCGFKAYNVDSLKKLKLTEWGYGMPLQLWIQSWQKNLSIKELPVGRIYKNLGRSFGAELDDPKKRLAYYKRVIEKELKIED